jgi:hypothetical protein
MIATRLEDLTIIKVQADRSSFIAVNTGNSELLVQKHVFRRFFKNTQIVVDIWSKEQVLHVIFCFFHSRDQVLRV